MIKLKKELTAGLWLFWNWLKKKTIFLFKEVIAWFKLLWMEIKEIGEDVKESFDELFFWKEYSNVHPFAQTQKTDLSYNPNGYIIIEYYFWKK